MNMINKWIIKLDKPATHQNSHDLVKEFNYKKMKDHKMDEGQTKVLLQEN